MQATNYFNFFHLETTFEIDVDVLNKNFRRIQSEVHPDKFVTASPAERLQSMQTATLANEAYQTLKHPTARARYLLKLQGIETLEESNTTMPADFLIMQMEWRESIEEAEHQSDIDTLDDLLRMMRETHKSMQINLADALSDKSTLTDAANIVRKLSFIDKVSADVQNIISKLEN